MQLFLAKTELPYNKAKTWVEEVARATGVLAGCVRQTGAWKNYEARRVEQWLQDRPGANGKDVENVFGSHPSKKPNLREVWGAHRTRQSNAKIKERQFADGETADRPDERTPSPLAILENHDSLLQCIKESVSPDTRAKIHQLSPAKQKELTRHVAITCAPALKGKDTDAVIASVVAAAEDWVDHNEQQDRRRRAHR